MSEDIKYDRNRLSKRNFDILDWMVYWGFTISASSLILSFILSFFVDFNLLGAKILTGMLLVCLFSLVYCKFVWAVPDLGNINRDKTWKKDYSKIIKDKE